MPFWGMVVCFLWMLGLLIMPRLLGNITVTDAVWLILDWEVIWHKNHLLCTIMGPEPSTLTLYCLCGSISTMAPNLCQLLSVIYSNWWSYIWLIKCICFSLTFSFEVFVPVWIILLMLCFWHNSIFMELVVFCKAGSKFFQLLVEQNLCWAEVDLW